MPNFT
jgi:hypothetical protein